MWLWGGGKGRGQSKNNFSQPRAANARQELPYRHNTPNKSPSTTTGGEKDGNGEQKHGKNKIVNRAGENRSKCRRQKR